MSGNIVSDIVIGYNFGKKAQKNSLGIDSNQRFCMNS
jgi:hypothetical protein